MMPIFMAHSIRKFSRKRKPEGNDVAKGKAQIIIQGVSENTRTSIQPLAGKIEQLAGEVQPLGAFGNYEILGEIARGGVGIIYKARQRGLDRTVALKVLQSGAVSPEHVQRFLHEAQAAAKLQHPNIVPIHDFGTHQGLHFFTMDYIEGESLAQRLARGPLPVREALAIARDVADALHYAHEHGVVHRDIKPSNILIDREGRIKVTDFGIAKELNRHEQMQLTLTGQVMGTPRYMSPEQASGHAALADRRSDVFSLGTTLYEMLTGVPAFDADDVFATLQKVAHEDPPPAHQRNPKVHRDVSTICQKAMEKAPERRYQTAREMADDIERFLAGEPIRARPAGVGVRIGRRLRKHWKPIAVNLLLLAAIGYLVKYYVQYYLASRPSRLLLQVEPVGARVRVDEAAVSPEALQQGLTLKPGRHRLEVDLEPLYDPVVVDFETKPAERITWPVSLARRRGRVEIETEPPDAAVTILTPGGARLPFRGPRVEQELPTGLYITMVYRENYLAEQREVVIEPCRTNHFRVALRPITVWSVPTSGNVFSVPAVADLDGDGWGDTVVGDDAGKVYCLSGKTGVVLWLFHAEDAVQAPIGLAHINDDEVPDVLVGSTDRRLYCLNGKDGKLLWSFTTGGAILGPPRLKDVNGDGTLDVFVGSSDGFLYAVSGRDGKRLWQFRTNGRIESALAWQRVEGGHVLLVGSADRNLYALDPRNGNLLWKVETQSPLLLPMRVEEDLVLVPTPQWPGDMLTHTAISLEEHRLVGVSDAFPLRLDLNGDGRPLKLLVGAGGTECYSADGKTLLWKTDYRALAPHGADVNGDGALELIFNNGPDEIVCLNGRDGTLVGQIKLDEPVGRGYSLEDVDRDGTPDLVVGAGRKVYCFSWVGGRKKWFTRLDTYCDAPLATVDDKLIVKNRGGEIAAYTAATSEPVWKVATSPQTEPYNGVGVGASALVADADAETRMLRVFSATNGAVLWTAKLPGPADSLIGWPSLGHGLLVVGDGNNLLHCFDANDGSLRWTTVVERVTLPVSVGRETACVAGGDGTLRCVALADGQSRWTVRPTETGGWASQPTLTDVNGDGVEDVIVVNEDGYTYAVNGRNGAGLWQFQHAKHRQRSRNRVVLAGPGTGVLATADGDLFCLALASGEPRWSVRIKEAVYGEATVADLDGDGTQEILVGTMNRRLHCFGGRDGALLWSYEVGGPIRHSAPRVLEKNVVFLATGPPENGLYCLRGECVRKQLRPWFGPWRSLSLTQ